MVDPWPRTRHNEEWAAQIIQPDGQPGDMLPIDPDITGRVKWDDAQSPVGVTLTIHGKAPVLHQGQLVQPIYRFDDVEYRLPALSVQGTDPSYEVGEWFDLSLVDQTIDYASDGIDFAQVFDAGEVIMVRAAAVLEASRPGATFTLPNLDLTLRNPLEFPIGTDPLLMVNKLMEAAGCTRLAPVPPERGDGLASQEWTPPSERPVRMVFGPGDGAGFLPQVRVRSDYLATPNVAHYETNGSASADQLVGRWRDEDPSSEWSIPRRRKRVFATPGRGEAASQAVADAHAKRIGTDHPGRGRVATIRGGFQPLVRGDVVETVWPDHPDVSGTWEIISASATTGLGSETEWVVKEVVA